MELYARIRVSFPPAQTLYRNATTDIWEIMFEPFAEDFREDEPFDTITHYPHPSYTNRTAGDTYCGKNIWRFRLHNQFCRLNVRREIMELVGTIVPDHVADCVGILYRGEKELAMEQRKGAIPSPEAMCAHLTGPMRDAPVFVCADSAEANDQFRAILGNRMLFWDRGDKCEKMGQSVHRGHPLGDEHVRKTLAMVLALSKTRHFIHAVSNMATAVLYTNPWLSHTFVEREPCKGAPVSQDLSPGSLPSRA